MSADIRKIADATADSALAACTSLVEQPGGQGQDTVASVGADRGVSLALHSYADVHDDVPTWVWEHGGKGRIPLGALTLFAGRPAAGKSTAARWFAAQVSRGTLPGEWAGVPHGVAYIAAEESPIYSVKPSLRAADADMERIWFPEMITQTGEDQESRFNYIPTPAMSMLARELRAHDVKLVVVDPLMTMMGAGTDIYRNNEVRERLQPWVDLAEQIDGVVIGIAHLNKSGNGDVLAGINGSSAFGELCRAAFGFAKDDQSDDGNRVMSQEKNSLGAEDLALTYSLTPVKVTTGSGRSAEMPKFTILGNSRRTVGQILRSAAMQPDHTADDGDEARMIVLDYLESQGGSAPAGDVLKVTKAAGIPDKTVKNKRKGFGVQTRRAGTNHWVWSLEQEPEVEESSTPQDLGTSGPSRSETNSEAPEQSRSQEPPNTRELRDLPAKDTPTDDRSLDDATITAVLDALSPDDGKTLGKLMRIIGEKTNCAMAVPDILTQLTTEGLIKENDGQYTLQEDR